MSGDDITFTGRRAAIGSPAADVPSLDAAKSSAEPMLLVAENAR